MNPPMHPRYRQVCFIASTGLDGTCGVMRNLRMVSECYVNNVHSDVERAPNGDVRKRIGAAKSSFWSWSSHALPVAPTGSLFASAPQHRHAASAHRLGLGASARSVRLLRALQFGVLTSLREIRTNPPSPPTPDSSACMQQFGERPIIFASLALISAGLHPASDSEWKSLEQREQ